MSEPSETPAAPEHGRWISSSETPDEPESRGQKRTDAPRPTTPTQPAASGCGTGCLIWAMIPVICLLLVVLIAAFDHGSASNAYPAEAQVHCRDFVKEALKSPSSAHFSNEQATGSGLLWTVNGEVDSDNSFGASIRNSYSCMVQVDKNDESSWTLISLTGLDN